MARIIGIVTTDAIPKTFNGKHLVEFSFLERRYYKGKDGERKVKKTWYNCTKWNSEAVAKHLSKGTPIEIIGTVEPNAYIDKNGETKASLKLIVHQFEFLPTPYMEQPNAEPQPVTTEVEEGLPF